MTIRRKYLIWAVIIIALTWYTFYALTMKMNIGNWKKFAHNVYTLRLNNVKSILFRYYVLYYVLPPQLDESVANSCGYPEDILYCCYGRLELRLSDPTIANILLFPIFPLKRKYYDDRKIKYSYVYDKVKEAYVVTLSWPFEKDPMFEDRIFEIPKDYDDPVFKDYKDSLLMLERARRKGRRL
jgi:hypothetical protein